MALAVHEDVLIVVEHRCTPIERDGRGPPAARARVETHVRLASSERLAQHACKIAFARDDAPSRGNRKVQQRRRNPRRCASRGLLRIGVERPVAIDGAIEQPLDEIDAEIGAARRAKADRIGDAVPSLRHAVMRPTRRQIEHVAGLEQMLLLGHEAAQHFERRGAAQRGVEAARDSPAPTAVRLEQEYVVAVDMRSDAAAFARPRDHHVVEPRVGHEPKCVEQLPRAVVVQVDALHEQRPAGPRRRGKRAARERAVGERPRAALGSRDEPRLDAGRASERKELRARQQRERVRERTANQERAPLPVPAHELGGRGAAEQGQRAVGMRESRHGARLCAKA